MSPRGSGGQIKLFFGVPNGIFYIGGTDPLGFQIDVKALAAERLDWLLPNACRDRTDGPLIKSPTRVHLVSCRRKVTRVLTSFTCGHGLRHTAFRAQLRSKVCGEDEWDDLHREDH